VKGCTFTARWSRPAHGVRRGTTARLVVTLDDETFDQVRARAVKAGTSVAEQIRQLVEFGLMDAA
jgi:hypothetical protein